MISALIIVFREVLEAGLIVGILWAVARNLPQAKASILAGIGGGIAGSALVAAFTGTIANAFEGYGQEIFNASVLGAAVAMLAWHSLWMSHHGRALASDVRQAGRDAVVGKRSYWALALIVFMAVLREGSEVVLFLYGVAIAGSETARGMLTGGLLGLLAGGLVSALTYKGLLVIPLRHFFSVTNWLITLLAAGMAAQSVSYLEKAGIINVLGQTMWDTSSILSEDSMVGRILHALVGYSEQPSAAQVLAYVAVVAFIWLGSTLFARQARRNAAASQAAA